MRKRYKCFACKNKNTNICKYCDYKKYYNINLLALIIGLMLITAGFWWFNYIFNDGCLN